MDLSCTILELAPSRSCLGATYPLLSPLSRIASLLWSQSVERLSTESSPFLPWQLHHFTAPWSCDCLDGINSSILLTLEKSKPKAQNHMERGWGDSLVLCMSKLKNRWVSWYQFCMSWSRPRSFLARGCRQPVSPRSYFGSRVSSWECCWCAGERWGVCSWSHARFHPCFVQQH